MELLEGQTLAQRIDRHQRLDLTHLLDIAMQVTDALESAHAKGIVHRDIKPAHIFLSPRGQVKILDFGIAQIEGTRAIADPWAAAEADTSAGDQLTMPGTAIGTVAYMSPEQARGWLTDARTDLFSLGTVLYQSATGGLPFLGDTSAMVFDAIFNRDPVPVMHANAELPAEFGRILSKALEKDRNLRYQTATDLKTDLFRLRRDTDPGRQTPAEAMSPSAAAERSLAVLFFENLSGVKEDEYFRDGIAEDIITELSKIKGLNIFSRATVIAYRDKPVTPAQISQQLRATCVLTGSLRRAGNRLRINAQLVDTRTDFPLWSERYSARCGMRSKSRTRSHARSPKPCASRSRRWARRREEVHSVGVRARPRGAMMPAFEGTLSRRHVISPASFLAQGNQGIDPGRAAGR